MSLKQTVQFIKDASKNFTPKIGLILGSGLGGLADHLENKIVISYKDIPGFPVSTVVGHSGQLVLGYMGNQPIVCLQGRVHSYEGIPPQAIRTLIRTLKLLGCEILILTNATGSLREEVGPGSLCIINDHINFQPGNPLVGINEEEFGPRFFSMDNAYDAALREQFHHIAKQRSIPLSEGVYISTLGPCFETPAEIRAFRILGADVVGMSTVPEVIVARHCGLRVAAISAVSNLAAGLSKEELNHELTLRYAEQAAVNLQKLIRGFIENGKF